VGGSYAYVASENMGVDIVDVSDPGPAVLVNRVLLPRMYVSTLALSDQYLYVLAGGGARIIDVSDPSGAGVVHAVSGSSWSSGLSLEGEWLYLLSYESVDVIDISDPLAASLVHTVDTGRSGSRIHAAEGLVFVTADDYPNASWLSVIDAAVPASASLVASVQLAAVGSQGYTYDMARNGDSLYIATSAGLCVVDISTPPAPAVLQVVPVDTAPEGLFRDGTSLYAAGWSALRLFDTTNPADPAPVGSYGMGTYTRALFERDGIIYAASYGSGLLILGP
jgi:hypothetical protein